MEGNSIITRSRQVLMVMTLGLVLSLTSVGVASAASTLADLPQSNNVTGKNLPNNATVNIGAIMHPKEGKADELRSALLSLVQPTREEAGCIIYNIYETKEGSFLLYEVWRSQEDLEKHFQKSYIKDFRSKANSLTDRNEVYFGELITVPAESQQ